MFKNVTIRLRRLIVFIGLAAATFSSAAESPRSPHIFMIGDSTMSNYAVDEPYRGWGMELSRFLTDPTMVDNRARSGRSTKSYVAEGHWKKALADLQPGDFVIIEFGHNDEKKTPKLGTDPATSFRDNLRRFITDTRAKGASPILATPVSRRMFNATGKIVPTHGAYPDATRAVAREEHVPLLDLERATADWLESIGDEPSKKYFVWVAPNEFPTLPEGAKDNTHFLEAGAVHVAGLAAAQIRALNLPLAKWLK